MFEEGRGRSKNAPVHSEFDFVLREKNKISVAGIKIIDQRDHYVERAILLNSLQQGNKSRSVSKSQSSRL